MSESETTRVGGVERPAWSQETDKLWPAMLAVRAAVPEIEKTATSEIKKKGTDRTLYTVKFRPLPEIIADVTPHLLAAGLFWWFTSEPAEGGRTRGVSYITHAESGQWFRVEFVLPSPPDSWGAGSFLTFMRRYLLLAQLGMQPHGEDDEGKAAQRGHREAERHQLAQNEADVARARSAAARKEAYKAAVREGGLTWDQAISKANAFAASCFNSSPGDLNGDQAEVLFEFLRFGGELPPETADDPMMPDAVRSAVAAWMGRSGASEAESERMQLLRAACGPETEPEEGIAWGKGALGDDPLGMVPGVALDTVRLWLHLGGHSAVEEALGKLGGGDYVAGASKLWRELDAAADVILATKAGDLVARLEGMVSDG